MKITINTDAPMPVLDEMLASLGADLDDALDHLGYPLGGASGERYVDNLRHRIWQVREIIKELRAGNHFIGTMSETRPAFED